MNIVITGGASGLGVAIAQQLGIIGNKLLISYNSSFEAALKLQDELPHCEIAQCDFHSQDSIEAFISYMEDFSPDILINNALPGYTQKHFHKTDPSVFKDSFETSILPVLKITQSALKVFRKKKSGRVITILTSYLVGNPPIGLSEYIANKSYLLSMNKSWARENRSFNISCNAVSPSFMLTRLTANTDERVIESMEKEHPLKQLLSPEEVAQSVVFLTQCSPQINGINMIINQASDVI